MKCFSFSNRNKSATVPYFDAQNFESSLATMQVMKTDKTQSSTNLSVKQVEEEDSFAKKRPIKRLARRSIEVS